jgi:glycosyltransferase involved in cell wall biosynthesis
VSRIVFFVANDLSRESRALREAASLAAAGHEVTVIGILSPNSSPMETRDGYRVLRVKAVRRPHRLWVRPGWSAARWAQWDRAYQLRRRGFRGAIRGLRHVTVSGVIAGVPRSPASIRRALRARGTTFSTWLSWVRTCIEAGLTAPRVAASRLADLVTGGSADWLAAWIATWEGWAREAIAAAPAADIWAVNDIFTIPAGLRARRRHGGWLVYHVRDLVIDSGPYLERPRWVRAWLGGLERRAVADSSAIVTTSAAMADWLRTHYDPRVPIVITHNCPPRPGRDQPRRTGLLRAAAGIGLDEPVAVYAGGFRTGRGIEQFVEALTRPALAGVHGILFGYGELDATLREWTLDLRFDGRLHVVPAFPLETFMSALADADVALAVFQPDTPSHRAVIPNKLFEALAAGVPVVASDTPGLRGVLLSDRGAPLGAVCDPTDPAAIATAIASILSLLPPDLRALRQRCHRAAFERWNWETEAERYLPLFQLPARHEAPSSGGGDLRENES